MRGRDKSGRRMRLARESEKRDRAESRMRKKGDRKREVGERQ